MHATDNEPEVFGEVRRFCKGCPHGRPIVHALSILPACHLLSSQRCLEGEEERVLQENCSPDQSGFKNSGIRSKIPDY